MQPNDVIISEYGRCKNYIIIGLQVSRWRIFFFKVYWVVSSLRTWFRPSKSLRVKKKKEKKKGICHQIEGCKQSSHGIPVLVAILRQPPHILLQYSPSWRSQEESLQCYIDFNCLVDLDLSFFLHCHWIIVGCDDSNSICKVARTLLGWGGRACSPKTYVLREHLVDLIFTTPDRSPERK